MESEVKPLSNEEDPVIRELVDEPDEGEDEARLKQKKPSDTDDDDEEPPPPYTTYDPQEEKSDDSKKSGGASSEGCEESVAGREEQVTTTQDTVSDTNLLKEHPKLIPGPSLGFQVQPVTSVKSSAQQQNGDPELDVGTEGTVASPRSPSESEAEDSSRPATSSPLSPADLSRISSPEKGRTLSEMTMITPEDEARVILHHEAQLTASSSSVGGAEGGGGGDGGIDSRTASSDSNTTLVNSQSQQSQPELTLDSNTTITSSSDQSGSQPVPGSSSSSSSGGGGLRLTSFLPRGKGKGKKHDKGSKLGSSDLKLKEKGHKKSKDKAKESAPPEQSHASLKHSAKKGKEKGKDAGAAATAATLEQNHTPQSPQAHRYTPLKVGGGYSSLQQQVLGNSQESFMDGLSPELSDYGDHSNEVDTAPREAKILRAGYNVGLNIDVDDKNSCTIVKSVAKGGAVGRDGRIRVGDRIEAINGKMLTGLSLNRAKGILKRAAKSDEICIMYSPAPGPAQFSLPLSAAGQEKARKSASDKVGIPHNPYYSMASMAAPLRVQDSSTLPSHGVGNIQMTPLPPQVQTLPPHMIQQGAGPGSVQQWPTQMEGVSPFHSGSMHHLPQGYYSQRPMVEDQMGKPPPPYLFPHQPPPPPPPAGPPGRMIAGQSPYGPMVGSGQAPPPPQMAWPLQQQQQQMAPPQGIHTH